MALDTQMPSARRRILLVVVLLAVFGGALGLAQSLAHRGAAGRPQVVYEGTDLHFPQPRGFVADPSLMFGDLKPAEAYRGSVAGRERFVLHYVATVTSFDDPAHPAQGEAVGMFKQLFGAAPQAVGPTRVRGDLRMVEVSDTLGGGQDFARLMVALRGRDIRATAYVGPGPMTSQDARLCASLAASLLAMGEPGEGE